MERQHTTDIKLIDSAGRTVSERFVVPSGYERKACEDKSFASYLRQLPLKEINEEVTYFDGGKKSNYNVYASVIDLPIGKKDLHQCADAVIRLRADYFRSRNQYDSIQFHFTNGFLADYKNWMFGKNIIVNINNVNWSQADNPRADSDENYWRFLEKVFTYAGTLSLSKEMKPKKIETMSIGDVFIKGGSPGHAVIIVDMAQNVETGERIFLLAQSYMPAQELQILWNPNNDPLNPWYSIPTDGILHTPEWTFTTDQLKSF